MMNGLFSQMEKMQETIDAISGRMEELHSVNEYISPTSPKCPASPFNPANESQNGSGAENRLPQQKTKD